MLSLRQVAEACERAETGYSASGARRWWPKNLAAKVHDGQFWCLTSSIPVRKVNGRWMAEDADVDAQVAAYIRQQGQVRQDTADLKNNIVHDGRHAIAGGFYTAGASFYTVTNDMDAYLHRSDGVMYCRSCHGPAVLEHNKPECHTCSDWGGCGRDCTLSAVSCPACGTREAR